MNFCAIVTVTCVGEICYMLLGRGDTKNPLFLFLMLFCNFFIQNSMENALGLVCDHKTSNFDHKS